MQLKPKLVHIITRMDWGGSPDIVRMLCEHTQDKYDTTIIIGKSDFQSETTKRFLASFADRVITISQMRREINPFWDICAIIRLVKIIKQYKFDIVHTHTSKAGFVGRIAARICKVKKIIHTPHGHVFYGYFPRIFTKLFVALEWLCAKFTDTIITLTCLEKNDLMHYKIAESKKIKVIASGIEEDRLPHFTEEERQAMRRSIGIEPKDIAVGMVSRLEEVKGGIYFIEAAAKANIGKIRFIVAGEGKQKSAMKQLAGKLNVNVNFLGWRSDAPQIIAALDILVQPSLNEAFALTILQANFLKTTVIASRTGGIPEIIADDINGTLTMPAKSEDIASAMIHLAESSAERKRLSENAYLQAQNYFTCAKMVDAVCEVYEE